MQMIKQKIRTREFKEKLSAFDVEYIYGFV